MKSRFKFSIKFLLFFFLFICVNNICFAQSKVKDGKENKMESKESFSTAKDSTVLIDEMKFDKRKIEFAEKKSNNDSKAQRKSVLQEDKKNQNPIGENEVKKDDTNKKISTEKKGTSSSDNKKKGKK